MQPVSSPSLVHGGRGRCSGDSNTRSGVQSHSHVLGDRCVADGVRGRGDAGLAAVAAATAVQAGHVHAVQVLVVLPAAVAQGVVLLAVVLLLTPGEEEEKKQKKNMRLQPVATRRSPSPPGEWGR